jgi:hypothetical protein
MPEDIKELGADKPAPEYTEMPDAYAPEREEKTYEGNEPDALRDAAGDLDDERRKRDGQEESPIIERKYVTYGGPDDGADRPAHETVSAERVAEDLTRQRDFEVGAQHQQIDEAVAAVVDYNRAEGQQQQQQQPVEQPQQQPQSDEEALQLALQRPAVRQAIEAQLQTVEVQRQQYAQAAENAFQMAAAGTLSRFSELQGLAIADVPVALKLIERQNPQRYAEMYQAVSATDRLYQNAQQAKAAEQQIQQARVQMWTKGEDARFNASIANEAKETVAEVTREGMRVLKEAYNIDSDGLTQMLNQNPGLRSAEAQRLLFDTIKNRLAVEKIAAKKAPANIPNVQRPGTSKAAPSYNDEHAESARRAFLNSPDPKTAAVYLQAKRDAKS